eukprot:7562711-Alexandrium_andersonii.AAC.1
MPRFGRGGGDGGGGGGGANFNHRQSPAWNPEHEQSYSFLASAQDIQLWLMVTDLQPHAQAVAVVLRLGLPAREYARRVS